MAQSFWSKALEFIGVMDDKRDDAGNEAQARQRNRWYISRPDAAPRAAGNGAVSRLNGAPSDNRRPRNVEKARTRSGSSNGGAERAMTAQPNRKLRNSPSTMVYYLHSLSECSSVIQDLIRGNSVLLNLEETDNALTQRIVDTLAGASFALNAKIRKVSEKMYLIAPENVVVNMTTSVERRY